MILSKTKKLLLLGIALLPYYPLKPLSEESTKHLKKLHDNLPTLYQDNNYLEYLIARDIEQELRAALPIPQSNTPRMPSNTLTTGEALMLINYIKTGQINEARTLIKHILKQKPKKKKVRWNETATRREIFLPQDTPRSLEETSQEQEPLSTKQTIPGGTLQTVSPTSGEIKPVLVSDSITERISSQERKAEDRTPILLAQARYFLNVIQGKKEPNEQDRNTTPEDLLIAFKTTVVDTINTRLKTHPHNKEILRAWWEIEEMYQDAQQTVKMKSLPQ
jgi:hypothetical protein